MPMQTIVKARLLALSLAAPLLATACVAQGGQTDSGGPATTAPDSIGAGSEQPSEPPSASDLLLSCADWTLPPSVATAPISGLSIRSIDRRNVEITNTTHRTYYLRVRAWVPAPLVCGWSLIDHPAWDGPIAAGEQLVLDVEEHAPITVEVWDRPCGEGCVRPPIAFVLVPMSSLDPPAPQLT